MTWEVVKLLLAAVGLSVLLLTLQLLGAYLIGSFLRGSHTDYWVKR